MIEDNDLPLESELDSLKARADQLGIKYHPSIGLEKLRAKVNAQLAGEPEPEDDGEAESSEAEAAGPEVIETEDGRKIEAREETDNERRLRMKKEANKMVRVRITCMNPAKSEWEGEIFTVSNNVVGTIKKMVPFDVEWHVPQMILKMIEERQYQTFVTETVRTSLGVQKTRKGKLVKEFAVERLPDLTKEELQSLAQRQAMANGTAAA